MPYLFTGAFTLEYMDYIDEATSKVLIAEPGGIYSMISVSGSLGVPPNDGRWASVVDVPPPPVSEPSPDPPPQPDPEPEPEEEPESHADEPAPPAEDEGGE